MSTARIVNLVFSLIFVLAIWPLPLWRFLIALGAVLVCELTQWQMGKDGEK